MNLKSKAAAILGSLGGKATATKRPKEVYQAQAKHMNEVLRKRREEAKKLTS